MDFPSYVDFISYMLNEERFIDFREKTEELKLYGFIIHDLNCWNMRNIRFNKHISSCSL